MLSQTAPSLFQPIVDDLAEHGWARQSRFLPDDLTRALADECRERARQGELAPARIGRGAGQQVREGVRGDRIQWLEAGQSAACDRYLRLMEDLREALNQALYLGLADYESHFACYPPGTFYQRHVDRFRDDDRRVVSVLTYLNDDWQAAHGGALRLHLPAANGERTEDIAPLGGSLVVFMSADLPHEVLTSNRERLSLAGWFRRRGDGLL
ncbi:2OG-Fe(II) oxygenase [Pseudomonas sp. LS44]|uniref:2OG-Fe(II) oxygenase n=1 Tax=Pseudomonas sp. LS44 TaxID=1357074 RepID=UPI00215ABE53|nr:2OG-Fe(II) oxygenase [Pseudomonas sp. LS44]UVE18063.1 2OG-Fe(II) oxygenase [Pseudomonas sp. LS44]